MGEGRVESRLRSELELLKAETGMGQELSVEWVPDPGSERGGEVKGTVIYIYEESLEEALETLRHEFVDYLVSQAIEPYKSVANKLIQLLNEEAYRRKERIIKALVKLL
jgi:hypothetical protein